LLNQDRVARLQAAARRWEQSMTGALTAAVRSLAPDARARIERAGRRDVVITGVTHDSRAVSPGVIFVAIRGQRADGAAFAEEAVRRGAAAIVAETPEPATNAAEDVPWLRTPDARLALAELADLVYARPSESLTVGGVTGTNGKTTTTYLLAAVFDAAGMPCGRIAHHRSGGPSLSDKPTRAHDEAPEVQRLLRDGRQRLPRVRVISACAGVASWRKRPVRRRPSSPNLRAITSTFTATCSALARRACSKCAGRHPGSSHL
jgi:UDP-N-acetylmuramoyl-L-alanyl-D-glutamate--2,6-diaminopimelate ligase